MKKVTVKLVPLGKEVLVATGTSLLDVLHEYGVEFPCGGKGTCGRCKIKLLEGEIETDSFHAQKLEKLRLGADWRLACQSRCNSDISLEVGQFEAIIQADETPFDFTPGSGLGIAFDLGTTTLAGQLIDLSSGRILAVETALNPQNVYGSDLISRLEAALAEGPEMLSGMIRKAIGKMIVSLCDGITGGVARIVIVGNTVMQHFFNGSDIRSLSFYPFESKELESKIFNSSELGWSIECGLIEFYPSIGSFVGSDILAGIEATGMHHQKEFSVLIDLGTNGEIVAGNRDRLLCASTAAGPAFEGAKISSGMLATTGAIASVSSIGASDGIRVIGDVAPRGICGSGLIDAVGVMLEEGLIGGFGEILSGEEQVMVSPPVALTQRDIQEFQLAKAAIAAGVEILLDQLEIKSEQVSRVFIAGAFGKYISVEKVLRTGMLSFPEQIVTQPGNTALMGARMFMFADQDRVLEILRICSHINLESEPRFQDLYVNQMSFNQ
ncbi:MAG: DUF4445 domain-containing protein [Bacteroidetes bacterium]|nr:DUF4445 domain-containing protein [Bacteroidota bacterium]